MRLSFFNPEGFYYSYAWSHSLCKGRGSFCTGLISRKLCGFLLMFLAGLALLHSVPHFFFLYGSSSLCTVFGSILYNIHKVLSINPAANETLTSIIRTGGTDRFDRLIDLVNSVIIYLSQITLLSWLTFLLGSQTVILTVLLFWISFF